MLKTTKPKTETLAHKGTIIFLGQPRLCFLKDKLNKEKIKLAGSCPVFYVIFISNKKILLVTLLELILVYSPEAKK